MTAASVAPLQDAATVMLLRDGTAGIEVLLLRRHSQSGFAADAWVFPGGTIDDADRTLAPARWRGIEPAAEVERLGAPSADLVLGAHVAAVREAFEEAGLLLATHRDGNPVDLRARRIEEARAMLADRETRVDFGRWLADEDIVLDLGALTCWSRWMTPRVASRRYDTWFFVARVPPGQAADHDAVETTAQQWATPTQALADQRAGHLQLIFPTIRTLQQLERFTGVEDVFAAARDRRQFPPQLPHIYDTPDGVKFVLPGDPDFPIEQYRDELGLAATTPGAGDVAGHPPPTTKGDR